MKSADFPTSATDWLQEKYPQVRKMKLYRETSDMGESYEAKFKWEGRLLSIEFAEDGTLQDIEKRIGRPELESSVWSAISLVFDQHFDRWRIIKIQEQTSNAGIRYEIEVKGKKQSKRRKHQYLFSERGEFIEKKEILDVAPSFDLY